MDNLIFHHNISVAVNAVVCLTLVAVVLFSKLSGAILPIVARLVGFDPAVMAGPLITTIVDALALIIYFSIAKALITGV